MAMPGYEDKWDQQMSVELEFGEMVSILTQCGYFFQMAMADDLEFHPAAVKMYMKLMEAFIEKFGIDLPPPVMAGYKRFYRAFVTIDI